MEEKMYLVEESLLRAMVDAYHKIMALEEVGIDDLEGDSNAYEEYLASFGKEHLTWEEFIDDDIELSTEVEEIPIGEEVIYKIKGR